MANDVIIGVLITVGFDFNLMTLVRKIVTVTKSESKYK